ncbi:MAG TPA: thiamine phosphate synthase, partial [Blastocatellia bacterium]|nr:thiamine phosphate synthase [Blastocatellia bacterium]
GPIFATTTKQNPDPVVGLDLLRQVRALTDRPLVAIGGITLERAADVIAAGADTVAIISALYSRKDLNDIFAKPDITGSTRAYIEALEGKGTTNRHE